MTKMKLAVAMLAIALGSIWAVSCGESSKGDRQASGTAASLLSNRGETGVVTGAENRSAEEKPRDADHDSDGARNDTDADGDGVKNDGDGDGDGAARGHFDKDDSIILRLNHRARAGDRRAIASLFDRYYALAAADDGADACRLMYPVLVRSLPEDEARRGYGPRFEQGLTTCPAIMSALFKHSHGEFSAPVKVVAVHVKGDRAIVLIDSSAMPLRVMEAERQGKSWKIDRFAPAALP
jgi:hypothetical protein